jgi:hypothetical protein
LPARGERSLVWESLAARYSIVAERSSGAGVPGEEPSESQFANNAGLASVTYGAGASASVTRDVLALAPSSSSSRAGLFVLKNATDVSEPRSNDLRSQALKSRTWLVTPLFATLGPQDNAPREALLLSRRSPQRAAAQMGSVQPASGSILAESA